MISRISPLDVSCHPLVSTLFTLRGSGQTETKLNPIYFRLIRPLIQSSAIKENECYLQQFSLVKFPAVTVILQRFRPDVPPKFESRQIQEN